MKDTKFSCKNLHNCKSSLSHGTKVDKKTIEDLYFIEILRHQQPQENKK